ncbi:MAG: glycosyltransferase [Gemmatales bacterium]
MVQIVVANHAKDANHAKCAKHKGAGVTERLRIAHVIGALNYGGVEAMALLLLKQLPSDLFEHHLIYIGTEPPLRKEEFSHHVGSFSQIPYRFRRSISFVSKLSSRLKELKIDAVLCHNFGNHPFIGMAARWAGIKRVYTIVASSPCSTPKSRSKNRMKGWLGRPWCNLEIAVSAPLAKELETELGLPARRLRTIVNCCPTREIGERADRSRLDRVVDSTDAPQLVMVARMDEAKDQDTLLRAIAYLKQQGRRIQLCLAGDGPRRALLNQLAEQLGLQDCVTLPGARQDIPELLGSSDLFVFSTRTEGFGLALIEAMSAGVPILSSDLDVCREILADGSCGMLFPVGDVKSLADGIAKMLDQPELARSFAIAARMRANEVYSPETAVKQYTQLLQGKMDELP